MTKVKKPTKKLSAANATIQIESAKKMKHFRDHIPPKQNGIRTAVVVLPSVRHGEVNLIILHYNTKNCT